MRQGRSFRQRMPTGARTPTQRAIAVLRRFGPDAHIYLPGVGMLNGLQAGNYIHSNGTGPGEVDQPVGLVLDATGSLGAELVTNGGFSAGAAGWSAGANWSISGQSIVSSCLNSDAGTGRQLSQAGAVVSGKQYMVSFDLVANNFTGTSCDLRFQDPYNTAQSILTVVPSTPVGKHQKILTSVSPNITFTNSSGSPAGSITLDNISVREVTGIHAQQPTTSAKPILRRGAVNLLTYSGDFSNAAWALVGTASKVGSTLNMPSLNDAGFHTATVAATASTGAVMLSGTGSLSLWLFNSTDFAIGLKQITLTSEPTLYFVNATPTVAGSTLRFGRRTGDTATSIIFGGAALFQGTYTAAQIQALGGIPTTLTAPVSTALGVYWWDTSGSKSLVATFPAGNESVTVINATPTGQVTTTAQNVVGAYSINTNTNGRIIVNGVLTASELALLQSYANRLAGL